MIIDIIIYIKSNIYYWFNLSILNNFLIFLKINNILLINIYISK